VAAFKREFGFISCASAHRYTAVHGVFRHSLQSVFLFVRVVVQIVARALIVATALAGFGVVGLLGPRVGNSSGVCPGSSSGVGGSAGSRTGGGASGWGFPGGSSCGGSAGVPGVAGGISGGSIGIYSATLRLSPARVENSSLIFARS
jgi:hypothetical protein